MDMYAYSALKRPKHLGCLAGIRSNMVTFNAAISASARCWRMALHFLTRADVAALPTGV